MELRCFLPMSGRERQKPRRLEPRLRGLGIDLVPPSVASRPVANNNISLLQFFERSYHLFYGLGCSYIRYLRPAQLHQ